MHQKNGTPLSSNSYSNASPCLIKQLFFYLLLQQRLYHNLDEKIDMEIN